jgi:hypothetical protein
MNNRIADCRFEALSNKMWRNILALEKTTVRPDTKEGKLREEALQILTKAAKTADIDLRIGSLSGMAPKWQGTTFRPEELLRPELAREILWELYEANFRVELLSIDALLNKTGQSVGDREILIGGNCWATGYVIPDLKSAKEGLNSPKLWERRHCLYGMHTIMREWSGSRPPSLCEAFPEVENNHDGLDKLAVVEKEIAEFYVTSFFKLFRRAAIVPHLIE